MPLWAERIFRFIFLFIDSVVYWIGSIAYRIFFLVSDVNIFDNSAIGAITDRIYTILGVIMLFVFAYNIILLIVNPDKMTDTSDKSMPGMVKNTIISVLVIALLPTIFNYMHVIQHDILESNIIGNLILSGSSYSGKTERENAGTRVMVNIFTAFYHPQAEDGTALTPNDCDNEEIASANPICSEYLESMYRAEEENKIGVFINNSRLNEAVSDGKMQYIFIISTICGGIAAYLFISFALDVGVRAVKLGVLQLVAPIPIIMRITKPNGGIFTKWLNELISTYVSVFIRVAVIFFAVFTIDLVVTNVDLWPLDKNTVAASATQTAYIETEQIPKVSLLNEAGVQNTDEPLEATLLADTNNDGPSSSENGILILVANVIVILGLLQFAKDAPKLLETLLGTNGSIRWRIRDKLNDNEYFKRASSAVGAVGGNLKRSVLDSFVNEKTDTGNTRRVFSAKEFGNSLRRTPFLYGASSGWKNGNNVDFSKGIRNGLNDIKDNSNTAVAKTREEIKNREQYRQNLRDNVSKNLPKWKYKKKDGTEAPIIIPGISHLFANLSGTINDIKNHEYIDKMIAKVENQEKIATSSVEVKNTQAIQNDLKMILDLAKNGIEDIKQNAKKQLDELLKLRTRGEGNGGISEVEYQRRVNEIKKKRDADIISRYQKNFTGQQSRITELLSLREKNMLERYASLSKTNQEEALKSVGKIDNVEIKELKTLVEMLKKGTTLNNGDWTLSQESINALMKINSNLTGIAEYEQTKQVLQRDSEIEKKGK